ncbi:MULTISPECIES: MerR family DNA-binding protein [Glaesserella]|uniref:MerR family transcriptional regulator n=1 Tax=Glaesserella australis TaxID=2094024 RepID=A0A328C0L4_9PAST|nr:MULTISPECIES: MerR family DNA-binding protein [Glaesserella]AUI66872.1 MerR family transcriptional regulator [Glaesserella sp. 15-184]RAL19923.1 MerR family transcriptional regulator [Glaesserella australis]
MSTFFKISELSKASGVNLETIRHYEKIGLITPAQRQANGYRLFGEHQLTQLRFVKTCRAIGFSLDEIRQLCRLQDNPNNRCQMADDLAQKHLTHITQQIEQLQQVQQFLEQFVGCKEDDVEHCRVIQGIKGD